MNTVARTACIVVGITGIAISAEAQRDLAASTLAFGPSIFLGDNGQSIDVDTATLVVPANRTKQGFGRISIPVVRFRSTATAPGAPIIYISGGSGSGIAAARGARLSMFLALRGIGDVITLDLRGAGRSMPRVDCGPSTLTELSAPGSYEAVTRALSVAATRCADSLRRTGVDLEGHNVREVVEDIAALRTALSASKIRLIGISTGSQLVLEYLRRHGATVDRIVAAGVQSPDQNAHSPAQQDTVLVALAAKLREGSPDAPDLVSLFRVAIDSSVATVRTPMIKDGADAATPIGIGPFDVQLLVAATMGDRRQMALLPTLLGAAARGNFAPLATMKAVAAKQGINSAFEALMDCQSSVSLERMNRIARERSTSMFGRATFDFPEHCAAWGVGTLPASYREPVRSTRPVLLISGTLDGRTPVRNAEEALRGLSQGRHLVIDGASHGDDLFLSSPDIVPTMLRFFRGDSTLPRHIHLVAN